MKKFYTVCPVCGHKAPVEEGALVEREQVEIEWKIKTENDVVKYDNHSITNVFETYVFCLYCHEFCNTDIMSCIIEEDDNA